MIRPVLTHNDGMEENVLQKLTNTQNDPMLAFARLALGVVYFAHGASEVVRLVWRSRVFRHDERLHPYGYACALAFLCDLHRILRWIEPAAWSAITSCGTGHRRRDDRSRFD